MNNIITKWKQHLKIFFKMHLVTPASTDPFHTATGYYQTHPLKPLHKKIEFKIMYFR